MHRVRVKIEGLRDPQTALEVARLGADAIGLVFAPSPRRVTPEQAKEIVAAVPPSVVTAGVFVNSSPAEIRQVVDQTGIDYVQLHGDEPPQVMTEIRSPCIKAFRVRNEGWATEVKDWMRRVEEISRARTGQPWHPRVERNDRSFWYQKWGPVPMILLLDAYDPAVRGGSGRRFNWDLITCAPEWSQPVQFDPIMLAGGLDPACVGEAVAKVRPWAVDVASGVESAPGVKDLGKVRAFIEAVRAAGRDNGIGDRGPGTRG